MKHIFYTLILFFICTIVNAQSNFKPGAVIDLKGDTIKGYIDYREWVFTPQKVSFKTNINDSKIKIYDKSNCLSFFLINTEYKRFFVNVSMDKIAVGELSIGIDSTYRTDTIFLKNEVNSDKLSLYSYTDNIKPRFFIQEGNDLPTELIYKQFRNPDDVVYIIDVDKYKLQLYNIASKRNLLTERNEKALRTLRYKKDDLIKLVSNINGVNVNTNISSGVKGYRLYAGVGINNTSLRYSGVSDLLVTPNNVYTSSIAPSFSIGFDKYINKEVQRVLVRLELSYTSANPKMFFDYSPPGGDHLIVNSSIKQTTIGITPQVIWNLYNTDKFKFYIDGGISINISNYKNEYSRLNINGLYKTNNLPIVVQNWISFPVCVGVEFNKRVSIYTGYRNSSVISQQAAYAANTSSVFGGVNYFFGSTK